MEQHARHPFAIALNLHTTEMNEYVETMVDDDATQARLQRFYERIVTTTFDPSNPGKLRIYTGSGPASSTNSIWGQAKIPMMLMEQRIGPSANARPHRDDTGRLEFGAKLIQEMAAAAADARKARRLQGDGKPQLVGTAP